LFGDRVPLGLLVDDQLQRAVDARVAWLNSFRSDASPGISRAG
jgi:hypothetical protein